MNAHIFIDVGISSTAMSTALGYYGGYYMYTGGSAHYNIGTDTDIHVLQAPPLVHLA